MKPKQIASYGLKSLEKEGADKAQCALTLTGKHEMNVDSGELALFRTTFDTELSLTALKGGKKGQTVINKSDVASIDAASSEVLSIAEASSSDEANDIAERQTPGAFSKGAVAPDLDKMHFRLKELAREIKDRYPKTVFREGYLYFSHDRTWLLNSNGVDLECQSGVYRCTVTFSSADGDKVSSFSYTGFSIPDLDKPLLECGSLESLIRQSGEQIHTSPVKGKFVGDIIIAPDCLGDVLHFLLSSITDGPLISGASIYKDSLGEKVASPLLTIHSWPVSDEICDGYFLTRDGYVAENNTILDKGILKSFLLGLYGANKTGRQRSVNDGGAHVVEPGETSLDDMIGSVKQGILMSRFSGGMPSQSGDFSGVAKNSFFIEDGKISYPISETMVSGNFAEMLNSVTAVSKERVDYGFGIYPWVAFRGATISGN